MKLVIAAFITSILIGLLLGPVIIPVLRRLKFGQTIREDGPQRHLQKAGTPTMGGLIFLIPFAISALVWGQGSGTSLLFVAIVMLYGLIGFADDLIIILLKRSLGLTPRQKLVAQFAFAFLFLWIACSVLGRGTDVYVPVIGATWRLGIFYYILMAVYMVGVVNAVNLTDGLDGLCSGITALVLAAYVLIAYLVLENRAIASLNYLDMAVGAAALAGGVLAFLVFNRYPAKVFMGDTGSLALGAAVFSLAVLTGTELPFLFLGAVYLLEALSVMIQVVSFKTRGKRVFLMAPLHHHYEMLGWSEKKVVRVFWTWAFVTIAIGVVLVAV